MDIEQNLFALVIWIRVDTLNQVQPKTCILRRESAFISIIKAHLSSSNKTASVHRASTLVQLICYILSRF